MSDLNILFDYSAAEKQAGELEALSRKLAILSSTDMEKITEDISHAWKGENAAAFLGKTDILKERILEHSQKISEIAETIRVISGNLKKADEQAASTAEEI